jgi:demethylmenaquinone methyltransferase/2-methoxy-6-polyprenyl-1,4-benzoquinol methylase
MRREPEAEGTHLGSGAMFDAIAGRYDLLNRLMSFGGDRRWRQKMVSELGLCPGDRVLDVATGTADVALEILHQEPDASVVGIDPSLAMLGVGRTKVSARGLDRAIALLEGDAESIPFPDRSFASATIAFGIRNVPDRPRALREMARVTRSGGRVCILELGEPRSWMARVHVHWAVPRLGALLSGSREYAYLQESMARFPGPADFSTQMEGSGLRVVSVTPFALGACHLFVAESVG